MPGFSYRVIDSDGRERKGNMNAPSKEQVLKRLTAEGLIIVDVDLKEIIDDDTMFGRGKITESDLSEFCLQLSNLLKAGIGPVNSLRMMAEQTEAHKLHNVIGYLAEQSSNGSSLAEAMASADVFPQMLIAAAEAGENEGRIADNLERMGNYYSLKSRQSSLIKKSIIYPSLIMIVILLVVAGVLAFIVPGFMSMINGMDIALPLSTRITVGVSNALSKRWWVLLLIVCVIAVLVEVFKRSRIGRVFFSRLRINYPGMYNRKQYEDLAVFTRLMSTMLGMGVPLTKSLELAGNSFADHIVLRRAILRAKDYVAAGGALSKQMAVEGFFPKLFINMIAVGEETGKLKEMFDNAASYYEKELDDSVRKEAFVLEPVMVAVLFVILGFVVISLVKPLLVLFEAVGSM